ncbi:hypothetical protein ACMGD3_23710 [Lysinibacillus sphaericus]|uniref:hypothetical protein n=1 Tax=Lysinibacillus sphaericus TaxID=1421 RepID=UPI003F7A200C
MEDNRYMKHMNWDFNTFNKFDKCHCESKKYYYEYHKCDCKHDKCEHERKHDNCECKKDKWEHERKHDKCECKKDKCEHERKHDKCECKHNEKHKDHDCKGCVCNLLKRFEPGTLVDVLLAGGGSFLYVYFLALDPKNCCAYFLEVGDAAAATPIVIDCQKIAAIIKRNSVA